MTLHLINRTLAALAAVAALAVAGGCATQTHAQAKEAANTRWTTTRANIMYSIAKQDFEVGDLDKAEKGVRQAIQTRPDRAEYYVLAARIALNRGELERAFYTLEQALAFDPELADTHFLMGVIFQRWQRYESALQEYELAYQYSPTKTNGLLAVAELLVKLDRTDEAIERLESKLQYFENKADIRIALGRMLMLRNQYDAAAMRFREASLLNPKDQQTVEYLATAEAAAGHYDDAIYHLGQLLQDEKFIERDDLRLLLGDCYLANNKVADAHAMYRQVTHRNPNDVNAWIKLAQAAWMIGDTVRLNESARRVATLAPKRYESYLIRGMVERQAGLLDRAIVQFEQAHQMAPDNALPLILLGMTHEQAGDMKAAAGAYHRAQQIAPNDPRPPQLLAALKQ